MCDDTDDLDRLFPYLRFLKANYSMDWKTFQRYFCDPDANDCHTRIATLLSYTMMRRTMKTTIMNRAIITLPPPHPEIRFLQFSAEERIIYRIVSYIFLCFSACLLLLDSFNSAEQFSPPSSPGLRGTLRIIQTNRTITDREPLPCQPQRLLSQWHRQQKLRRIPRPTTPPPPVHLSPVYVGAYYQRVMDLI